MAIIIRDETYQPHFAAYVKHYSLKPGDTVKPHEYLAWISEKSAEFWQLMKLDPALQAKDFTNWLLGGATDGNATDTAGAGNAGV